MPMPEAPLFPARGVEIVRALYEINHSLAHGTEDDRRSLTRRIIEQLVYEFPGQGYGWKSADPSRPPSKDTIARQFEGRLYGWDWQNGATRGPLLHAPEDITGQHFIPIDGVNHLQVPDASPVPQPVPAPQPSPSETPLTLEARIATLEARIEEFGEWSAQYAMVIQLLTKTILDQMQMPWPTPHPAYEGRLLGVYKVRVTPVPSSSSRPTHE